MFLFAGSLSCESLPGLLTPPGRLMEVVCADVACSDIGVNPQMIALPGRLLRKDDKRLSLDISRKISDLKLFIP